MQVNKIIIATLLFLKSTIIFSQIDTTRHAEKFKQSFYLEVFGNSTSILSLNYERFIYNSPNSSFHSCFRVGFGFYKRSADSAHIYSFPTEVNLLIGKRKHFIEVSAGWTAAIGKEFIDTSLSRHYKNFDNIYVFRLGYRFTGKDGVPLVRFSPLLLKITNYGKRQMGFSFGAAIGVSFQSFKDIW